MIQNELEYFKARRCLVRKNHERDREVETCDRKIFELEEAIKEYETVHDRGREGTWMPTYTGRRFWLLDPRPEDFDIRDIAHGLSRISRFNGATKGRGYTVAQHSVLASTLVPPPYRLAILMHDAPEAYAGDVISPLKRLLGAAYEKIETAIMTAIAIRYEFVWDDHVVQRWVHKADRQMLASEVRWLVPTGVLSPGFQPQEQGVALYEAVKLVPWEQDLAETMFLQKFEELTRVKQKNGDQQVSQQVWGEQVGNGGPVAG